MKIIKRDGKSESYQDEKIKNAIRKAFLPQDELLKETELQEICNAIRSYFDNRKAVPTVEKIQDLVEEQLMERGFFKEAKRYILYREKRTQDRTWLLSLQALFASKQIHQTLMETQRAYPQEEYSFRFLYLKLQAFLKEGMQDDEKLSMLMKASVELISQEAPKWEYIAARFLSLDIHRRIDAYMLPRGIDTMAKKMLYLDESGYLGKYIRQSYRDEDIAELEAYLKPERDHLFTYSGLELVMKRYLITSNAHELLETPQEMFMGIAMHLAIPEKQRVYWAKQIYDILSTLKVTMATPTMSNARKPYHQLSSCFIDTVPDSLTGIYQSLDNFAQVSKYGGGMGLYFGKVRAVGSDIRGFEGAAGGVIRWIKLVNNTATAVDQLGVRQGAVAVYLDAWHKDLPEFLQLRTNNGDDRQKAHDVFPAVCYPDLFWKMAEEDMDQMWYLMCPHEIETVKGYCLEDSFGELWEKRYLECVQDSRISKRAISLKELIRLIIKSAVETGTPFAFMRDTVNRLNPNAHKGMIYCSNLCTEIAQNMSSIQEIDKQIVEVDGATIVVERNKAGDFVVCNLASLILGNMNVNDPDELKNTIRVTVRALDNVIDLNYYPLPYAKITNQHYRSIGLGTSGYHHMLVKQGIAFESEEHLTFVDKLYEDINYYTIEASSDLAKEKGRYDYFEGSKWQTGEYFEERGYREKRWKLLREQVQEQGMRNAYLLAIAPTSSTSIIAGTSAAVDPIMNKFFMEEKKGSMIARVAPDLSPKTFWLYKNAHLIDQQWVVKAAGVRQRHIDQAQSVNLYITNEFTMRQVFNLYLEAWKQSVKTIYYVRSKSLEVEECESCAS